MRKDKEKETTRVDKPVSWVTGWTKYGLLTMTKLYFIYEAAVVSGFWSRAGCHTVVVLWGTIIEVLFSPSVTH